MRPDFSISVIIVCLVQREIKEGEILIDERKEKRRR
jgi:hypothetical protein